MSLIDFLRAHNIPQSRGGVVTNAEYQKALAAANFDKAVEKGKMTSADAALRKAEMLAVKPSAGQKKAAKKAREASKQVIAPPV